MNQQRFFLRATGLALLISAAAMTPAWAASYQGAHSAHAEHPKPIAQAATGDMTDGEVRKVDTAAGKISLKHGEIKNLDMPPMTMVFQVSDPALLGKVKAGDKVRFTAMQVNGAYTVTSIEAAP
jgi:Cu/Ag efflux protein CusF